MDRIAKALAGALPFLGVLWLLGSQSARIGSYFVPSLSPWWMVAAIGLVLLLTPSTGPAPGRRRAVLGASLLVSFVLLHVVRSDALHPSTSVDVVLEDGRKARSVSLQIERRNELRRLTGERRNVAFEARGFLEVQRHGRYVFEVACDDSCEVELGESMLRAEGELRREILLARGEMPLSIRYRQSSGPARLSLRWDTPASFEPLPIDYFVRSLDGAKRSRIGAHLALGALGLWWIAFAVYVRALARERWKQSPWVPITIAALLILYGALLRFEAFLAHTDLPSRSEWAASVHEGLRPWVPSWGLFNPENAPEDPYRADVRSYLDRAEAMGREGFYAPSFREPFYVLLVRGFVGLAQGEIGILIESFAFSVLTLVVFYLIARRMHGLWWASAVLVPVVLHQWLVLDSPTGYRESAYSFFLLALVGAFALGEATTRSGAFSGLLGALLCLIRLSALSIVAPLLAVRLASMPSRKRVRYATAFTLVLLLLVGPFLWSNYRAHGDPLYSVSFHTQFWLRAEGLDATEGPVSISRYFADFGRAGSLVKGTLLGLTVLPLRTFWNGLRAFPLLGIATLGFGVVGLLLVRRGATRFLTAAYFGHLFAFAYIQNFPSGEMPRFVMPAFFLLVLAAPFRREPTPPGMNAEAQRRRERQKGN